MSQPTAAVPNRWISAKEFGDQLGVSPRTLQRLASDGRIKHHVIPGTSILRFSPEDVAAFEAEAQKATA